MATNHPGNAYIRTIKNGYLLHFGNYYKLTTDTIHRLFSKCGVVLNVDTKGKEYGLVFVTMATLEDARRCVENSRALLPIKLLKHKYGHIQKNCLQESSIKIPDLSINDPNSRTPMSSRTCSQESLIRTTSMSTVYTEVKDDLQPELLPLKRKIKIASELIITNIANGYGLHYILHLVRKYNPIAGSIVKTIPNDNIRYCIIYFQSSGDLQRAKNEVDDCELGGKCIKAFVLNELLTL